MNDSIVTPENTKLIAKWVGYEAKATSLKCSIAVFPYAYEPKLRSWKLYNPITNAEQSREVEKKLLIETSWQLLCCRGIWYMQKHSGETINGKTLELIIYKASLYEAKK